MPTGWTACTARSEHPPSAWESEGERLRLFDMHCDTLYECCKSDAYLDRNRLQVDLERGGRYAQWGQAFAVWMPDTLRGEGGV